MATLSAGGIGSGLDVNTIVQQLMRAEQQPLDRLNTLQKKFQSQISAYGKIKSALSTFETAMKGLSTSDKFKVYSATPADTTVLSATADTTAVPGTHTIQVIQLAKVDKRASTSSYADANTSIGATGTLSLTVGTNTFSVDITAGNNTLAGIRDAINGSTSNTSVTASVINVDDGLGGTVSRMVLTGKNTGTANTIAVSDTSGNVAATLNMAVVAGFAAQDAKIKVDGYDVTRSSNSISDALQGVTLNLNKDGVTTSLNVTRDTAKVKENVQKFVDSYNSLRKTLKDAGGEKGDLRGDSALLSIERQIRNVLNTAASGLSYGSLADIGLKTQSDGTLTVDGTKLDAALSKDYAGVSDLFSHATQGFAVRLQAVATSLLATDGLIATREEGLNDRVDDVKKRQDAMNYRLEQVEKRYRAQFTALDSLMTQLNQTSNYLARQLANL